MYFTLLLIVLLLAAVSLWAMVNPEGAAASLGFAPSGQLLAFFAYAYLGMSLLSLLALRYRRSFVIAPAVCWAVYLGGANTVHLRDSGQRAAHRHGALREAFATHGLIAIVLVVALVASGLLKERS